MVSIAPRVLAPCKCGRGNALRIEPELRELEHLRFAVAVVCMTCQNAELFDAAALGLGLVPSPPATAAAN